MNTPAKAAAEIESKLANSARRHPACRERRTRPDRLPGGARRYMSHYSYITRRGRGGRDFQKNIGWARYPRSVADRPSAPRGGFHIAVVGVFEEPRSRLEAAECLGARRTGPSASRRYAAHHRVGLRRAEVRARSRSTSDCLSRSTAPAAALTPAYSDISRAIQKDSTTGRGDRTTVVEQLRDRIEKAATGRSLMEPLRPQHPGLRAEKQRTTDRARRAQARLVSAAPGHAMRS